MAIPVLALLATLLQVPLPTEVLAPLEPRVRHLRERLECADPEVRLRASRDLTSFTPRDSRAYPPLFQRLLEDPSPQIAWRALVALDEHGVRIDPEAVPVVLDVPTIGVFRPRDPDSLAWMRGLARPPDPIRDPDPPAPEPAEDRFRIAAAITPRPGPPSATPGWAIRALGLVGDVVSLEAARSLDTYENVFVRYSAALARMQLGDEAAGRERLRSLAADFAADASHWYSALAAERLVRCGEEEFLAALIALIPLRRDYAEGTCLLEDLTGEFFPTEEGWRAWWHARGGADFVPARR